MRRDGSKCDPCGARRTSPPGYSAHRLGCLFSRALWRRVDAAGSRHSSEKAGSIIGIREARAYYAKECRAHIPGPNGIIPKNASSPIFLEVELVDVRSVDDQRRA